MLVLKLTRNLILGCLLAIMCANGNAQLITDSIVQINEKKFGWLYIPTGTGCVIKDGYVLTAYHIVDEWPIIEIRDRNRQMHKATVICGEMNRKTGADWAVLHVPTLKAPPLAGYDGRTYNGEQIVCYHDCKPISMEVTPSHGVVDDYWFQAENLRHTTAEVKDGFSGSPVVNSHGFLIGVVSQKSARTSDMYFVPYSYIKPKLWWLFME